MNASIPAAGTSAEDGTERTREHLQLLLEVNNALVSNLELPPLFHAISAAVRRVVQNDYCSLCLYDAGLRQFQVHALDFPGGRGLIQENVVFKVEGSPAGDAFTHRRPLVVGDLDRHRFPGDATRWLLAEGIASACWLPLLRGERCLGVLCVGTRHAARFSPGSVALLSEVASQVAIAVENALAFQQIKELKDRLTKEKTYLEDQIRAAYDCEEMVGNSPEWKQVLEEIATVAPTDANVLILGETGTGKELVARAIHDRSRRRDRTFVKLNCAAVPTGLLESELFGHEKGAYTGAIVQQIGRFELAHKGTLLLDEIGDVPLELQPKLLRALQEQQFERLGSPRTIQVDVRLIASTNRNLEDMIRRREFREDLFYRLNVFPIALPPLRERRSDIPLLVRYFVNKYSTRVRCRIDTIPAETMERLMRAEWHGNVRELENFIERAMILSPHGSLSIPAGELRTAAPPDRTLESSERELILQAVRDCHGVIGGVHGAATRLGLKRTTLNSRMKKLDISRHDCQ
jgi:formate hydrogenlyase transcriptional activator